MNFGYQPAPRTRVVHLGEDEGGLVARSARAGGRAATVKVPVPQPKAITLLSQMAPPLARRTLASLVNLAGDGDPGYQAHYRGHIHYGDQADQRPGHHPQPSGVAVDPARVGNDRVPSNTTRTSANTQRASPSLS